MRFTKVLSTQDGGARFEDVDAEMKPALAAKGVPPLLLSLNGVSLNGPCTS